MEENSNKTTKINVSNNSINDNSEKTSVSIKSYDFEELSVLNDESDFDDLEDEQETLVISESPRSIRESPKNKMRMLEMK